MNLFFLFLFLFVSLFVLREKTKSSTFCQHLPITPAGVLQVSEIESTEKTPASHLDPWPISDLELWPLTQWRLFQSSQAQSKPLAQNGVETPVTRKVSHAWVLSCPHLPSASLLCIHLCYLQPALVTFLVSPLSLLTSSEKLFSLTSQFFLSAINLVWLVSDLWGEMGRPRSQTPFWDKWEKTEKVFPIRKMDLLILERICFSPL